MDLQTHLASAEDNKTSFQNDIRFLIKSISDRLKVCADADLYRYHLTLSQSRVLWCLEQSGGQATQKEIERFHTVSHPTVIGIVSHMKKTVISLTMLMHKTNATKSSP